MIGDDEFQNTAAVPAWCHPTRAKDMLHGSALFVRDMLAHDRDALYDTYGIQPDEAAQSLRYVELAELRAWGIEEMQEAVNGVPNQASGDGALRRRINMAMRAEGGADVIHPGDAVLFLERSGLMLPTELREAVVFMSAGSRMPNGKFSCEDENRLRQLLGQQALPESMPGNEVDDAQLDSTHPRNIWDIEALARLQSEAKLPGATHEQLAKKYGVSRQMISKLLGRARDALGPPKAGIFDGIMGRNRK